MKHKTKKDRRKPLTGAKAVDNSCKNNGTCTYCESNRTVNTKKRLQEAVDRIKSFNNED